MYSQAHCEYLRIQSKQKFDRIRESMLQCGQWALPHRTRRLTQEEDGTRSNKHIVDPTHILALRSYVAGFLEGNTSASRPWYKIQHPDPEMNRAPKNKEWIETLAKRTFYYLASSNFYTAAGGFYYDFGVFNTGCVYIEELKTGLHFHILEPGSYYALNNGLGVADTLVREFSLTVKALVDTYGNKKGDWSNFSSRVKKMYQDGNYTTKIDICHIIKPNPKYDPNQPEVMMNRPWLSLTYELGSTSGQYYQDGVGGTAYVNPGEKEVYLRKASFKRKPFIVGRSDSSNNFEYGEKGPTLDALGLIKSLNKKAIGKDIALDQMLKPAVQGPANLRRSYISTAPNSYVPLDAQSAAQGGLKRIFEINPAIATLNADVNDLRQQVEKLYYADYLLFLTRNPKTRTATETNAVIQEQQLIIGPNLQSLNWTFNDPIVDFMLEYVLEEDPYLPPPPEDLQGETLRAEFISVFAQAQKAADLPSIEKYAQAMMNLGQIRPEAFDKFNLDKLADLYEDRLYLPVGLNNPQNKVEAMREKRAADMQRQQMLQETVPALAGAAKNVGMTIKND